MSSSTEEAGERVEEDNEGSNEGCRKCIWRGVVRKEMGSPRMIGHEEKLETLKQEVMESVRFEKC